VTTESGLKRAAAVAIPIIAIIISTLFAVSYIVSTLLGLPFSLGLPVLARLAGIVVVLLGLAMIGWVFKHRSPVNMVVSTYITLEKMLERVPVSERAGRTEPLIVDGPQRCTRNPLYFGVVVMVLGFALLGTYTFVFIATLALLLWFSLILIPFEEKELRTLFGEQWVRYSEETPMLVPFTKRRKRANASQ
jgi:protein-S-isoprenylcysteine O-methyltransferase Ste14